MSISKRRRFAIFDRDGFTCVYCGAQAPDVRLEVDHVIPRSSGGSDAPSNLVTACWDCNRGKAAYPVESKSLIDQWFEMRQAWHAAMDRVDDLEMEVDRLRTVVDTYRRPESRLTPIAEIMSSVEKWDAVG